VSPEAFERKIWEGGVSALRRGETHLVGVSGGRDSVALLEALVRLGFEKLVVCHLDHGLRGRASAGDARFVAALAKRLGLEAETGRADVAEEAGGSSLETAAREARYRFFAQAARRRRAGRVILAHHADDQVETLLFNLFRGTGLAGLGGMKPFSRRAIRLEEGRPVHLALYRPMLGLWREEIDAYVAARRLRYREDASNRSMEPMRNRIRHELIPAVERLFGRAVRPALLRTAELAREEEALLGELAGPAPEGALDVPTLKAQPVALQRRQILAWLRRAGVPEAGYELVERVRALLAGGAPAKVNLPGGRHVRRREKRLFIE